MRVKSKSISLASTFLILAVMTFSLCNVQSFQATPPLMQSPLLIPPPPSAPYWTYQASDYMRTVAISSDGNTIVSGSTDHNIYVFSRQSNATLWKYKTGHQVVAVDISADGNTIVACSVDQKVYVFSRGSNTTIWTYKANDDVSSVAVSADGNTIAAGTSIFDHTLYVFGRASNTTIWKYKTGSAEMRSVDISSNGDTIVAGDTKSTVRTFSRLNNNTLWVYNTSAGAIFDVAVSADGNTIVSGGGDNIIRAFDRQSNRTLWSYTTKGFILDVAVSHDGTTIVAGSIDKHLLVFGRTSNTTLVDYVAGFAIYHAVAVSSDGSTVACGVSGTTTTRKALLFSKDLGLLWSYPVLGDVGTYVVNGHAVAISSDGSLVGYACGDGKLYVFQYDTAPPVLGTPSVSPSSPVGDQSVNISISVTDNVAVSAVTLYYKNESASSWSSVAMSLADSVYRARVGPFTSGSTIDYYVSAEDSSGNTASSPADAPLSYYVFTVGQPPAGPGIEWTSVLIGAALGAVIAIVVSFVLLRGKRGRK